jgi:hypothetical protein
MWACTFSISVGNLLGSCGSKNLDSLGHYNLQVISSELCENEIKSRRKINVNRRVEIISAVKA